MNLKNIVSGMIPNGSYSDSSIPLINPVDINKAVPILVQQTTGSAVSNNIGSDTATVSLINDSTIKISRGGNNADYFYTVLVVEFNEAKSVQSVEINASQSSTPISPVNISNNITIISSWKQAQNSTLYTTKNPYLEVTSSSTLTIKRFSNGASSNTSTAYIVEL